MMIVKVFTAGARIIEASDAVFSLVPGYDQLRGLVLDIVLGPE